MLPILAVLAVTANPGSVITGVQLFTFAIVSVPIRAVHIDDRPPIPPAGAGIAFLTSD
jgi:hypothetical protein